VSEDGVRDSLQRTGNEPEVELEILDEEDEVHGEEIGGDGDAELTGALETNWQCTCPRDDLVLDAVRGDEETVWVT
jgi:hypothetical protein